MKIKALNDLGGVYNSKFKINKKNINYILKDESLDISYPGGKYNCTISIMYKSLVYGMLYKYYILIESKRLNDCIHTALFNLYDLLKDFRGVKTYNYKDRIFRNSYLLLELPNEIKVSYGLSRYKFLKAIRNINFPYTEIYKFSYDIDVKDDVKPITKPTFISYINTNEFFNNLNKDEIGCYDSYLIIDDSCHPIYKSTLHPSRFYPTKGDFGLNITIFKVRKVFKLKDGESSIHTNFRILMSSICMDDIENYMETIDSRFYGNINSYFYKYDDEKNYVIFDMLEFNPITVKQLPLTEEFIKSLLHLDLSKST